MIRLPAMSVLVCFFALPFLFDTKDEVKPGSDIFSINKLKGLNKILLYNNNLPSSAFYRNKNGGWQLNNVVHVDRKMSELLLTVLTTVKVKASVSKGKREEVIRYLRKKGLVVEYYNQDLLSKAFFVAAVPGEPQFSYAMLEGTNEPLIISVSNAKHSLEELLSLAEYNWQDRTLFNNSFESITHLRVEYLSTQRDSFEIRKKGKDIYFNDELVNSSKGLKTYLDHYKSLHAGGVITKNAILIDSLKLSSPYCRITVKDDDENNNREVKIYVLEKDSRFIYGQIDSKDDVFIIPFENIKDILLKREELLKKIS